MDKRDTLPRYTDLVLSGGGFSGFIYFGIYRFLKQYHLMKNIHHIYGTSIGSMFSFLIGFDMECEELERLFIEREGIFRRKEVIQYDPKECLFVQQRGGIYSTQRFRDALEIFLQKKYHIEDITFQEYLKRTGKDLHIYSTCLNTCRSIDFCNEKYPNMSVLTAIQASIAVPMIFQPIEYEGKIYVDGGCCENFPIKNIVKDTSKKVLGINIGLEPSFSTEYLKGFLHICIAVFISILVGNSIIDIDMYQQNKHIDLINILNNPIPAVMVNFEKDYFYTDIPDSLVDTGIVFGYQQLDQYFHTKGYFSQM